MKYLEIDESGAQNEKTYEIKAEKAILLHCEERLCNGKISQVKPEKKIDIVAWDYFGVGGCNFVHPGIVECDSLRVFITPNQIDGVLLGFPDWDEKDFFDTSNFIIFSPVDVEFDFNNSQYVQEMEDNVNEGVLPMLLSHKYIDTIDPEFELRSHTIFKAFDKYWSAFFYFSKSKVKKFEKECSKKNIERDYFNKVSIEEIISKH